MQNTNLFLIFVTGLTSGGLSCLAIQGSLLAAVITKKENEYKKKLEENNRLFPILSFLTSKLVAYTILGFILGLIGSSFTLTPIIRGYLQIAIGIYLLGVAGATLDLHPYFRYFIITPPKFMARLVKDQSKNDSLFAPALLGAFTILLPCAFTQAMEVLALTTGNGFYGAAIMFAFILGTTPTFLILGYLYTKISDVFRSWFYKVAAALLVVMSVISINGGIGLTGSIYTLQNFYEAATSDTSKPQIAGATTNGDTQEVTINVFSSGYTPKVITLKKGVKTKLRLITDNVQSCARAFTIPRLNIQKLLPESGTTEVEFTPNDLGPLAFSCSMGMYTGQFNVVN